MYHYHDEKNSTNWEIGHAPGLLLETLIDPQYVDIEPSARSFKKTLDKNDTGLFFFSMKDMRANQSYIFCTADSSARHEWVSALKSFSCSNDEEGKS